MKLNNKIYNIFGFGLLITPLLLALSACKDNLDILSDEVPRQDNLPVEFEMNIQNVATRGPSYFKKEFEADDVVHVEGRFRLSDNSLVVKYAAMRYDGEKWNQYNGATGTAEVQRFSWPNNAIDADFTAYFIHGSNSLMVPTDNPDATVTPTTLTSVAGTSITNPDKDPLKAKTLNVRYGHTISFDFIHACAYLTVEELPAGVSNIFWFTRETVGGKAPDDFKNAFRLYLDTDNKLSFEFLQVPDPEYNDKVYVQGTTTTAMIDGFEKAAAGFFLAPGQYLNFVVGYPGSNEMVNYISYSKDPTADTPGNGTDPGDEGDTSGEDSGNGNDKNESTGDEIEGEDSGTQLNPNNELVENGVYTFNVSKSNGVKIETKPEQEGWDEGEDPIYDVDAEAFLWAICQNKEYYVGDVQIIKPEGTTSKLLKNVNIKLAQYNVFAPSETNGYTWFEPSLGQGVTFDGGLHYIWNLGSPLFMTVDGTVKNLGLANAQINVVTKDEYTPGDLNSAPEAPDNGDLSDIPSNYPAPGTYDLSRQGAICGYLNNGTIENIRIKAATPAGMDLTSYPGVFRLNAEVWGIDSQESHNVGGLIGSNANGTINGIAIRCDMEINVNNYTGTNNDVESHVPRMYIGGIIGQNVNILHDVSSLTGDNKITIINSSYYANASFSIGGVVGNFSGGTINNVTIPTVFIDSRNSYGFTSFIGGAAGRLSNVDNGGKFLNINVAGSVYAGKSMGDIENNGSSYTGGLAGECYESYEVTGCYANVNVYGPYNDPTQGYDNLIEDGSVVYGTGGMFGYINNLPGDTPSKINFNISTGKTLRGPWKYIGSFAGTVPKGETWEKDYEGNDLIIQTNLQLNGQTIPPIGGTHD